jgi:hypothetical protein
MLQGRENVEQPVPWLLFVDVLLDQFKLVDVFVKA